MFGFDGRKRKTQKLVDFIEGMHRHVVEDRSFRTRIDDRSEYQIQTELRPLFQRYLEEYFRNQGERDPRQAAGSSFYWEGQQGNNTLEKIPTFGSKNYPDFIIKSPYKIAVEYKQGSQGSLVKHGIGQSIMHTMGGEYEFVYYLFHDTNKDKRIATSSLNDAEKSVIQHLRDEFNVFMEFV